MPTGAITPELTSASPSPALRGVPTGTITSAPTDRHGFSELIRVLPVQLLATDGHGRSVKNEESVSFFRLASLEEASFGRARVIRGEKIRESL